MVRGMVTTKDDGDDGDDGDNGDDGDDGDDSVDEDEDEDDDGVARWSSSRTDRCRRGLWTRRLEG